MRLNKLAMTALFGALLAVPAVAQTAAPTVPTLPAKPAVPALTVPTTRPALTVPTTRPAMPTAPGITSPINLNTATPDQLDSLPGIGKSRTKKIIAARPFTSVDQLDTKKVVPHSVFEKIKGMVTI